MGDVYPVQTPSESKLFIESLMNIYTGYTATKSDERIRYEENVHDEAENQQEMKNKMIIVKNHESFEIFLTLKLIRYICSFHKIISFELIWQLIWRVQCKI